MTIEEAIAYARQRANIRAHVWHIFRDRNGDHHPLISHGSHGCGRLLTDTMQDVYWINSYGAGGPSFSHRKRREHLQARGFHLQRRVPCYGKEILVA